MANGIVKARPEDDGAARVIESLIVRGDISDLSPKERATYYVELCRRCDVDPMTTPFLPLRLNNKEILYATKVFCDQVSRKQKLSRRTIAAPAIVTIENEKIIQCVVEIAHPNGRVEQATGAVPLPKGAEAICNALMKSETKAKRRGTLSLIGLGMLDESELDTIPTSQREHLPPIDLGVLTAKRIENERRSEEPAVLGVVEAYHRALQSLTAHTIWSCAACWVEWEPALREECESEDLHDLQLVAKGHALDATSMAAWKFAVDATRAAQTCEEVKQSLDTHTGAENGGDFVASWRVYKAAVAKLPEDLRLLCWELHWRGYNRVCNIPKGDAAFRKALGEDTPPKSTKSKPSAAPSAAEGTGEASAAADAPQASVSYLVPLSESQRYVASADEWRAHCAGYKHREHALHSWAKHCAAFRAAGESIYKARMHTAAERFQVLASAVDVEVCKIALLNQERTAEANARKHAEAATTLRKAG